MGSPSRIQVFLGGPGVPGPVRLQPGVPGRLVRGEVADVVRVVVFLVPVLSWALHGPQDCFSTARTSGRLGLLTCRTSTSCR